VRPGDLAGIVWGGLRMHAVRTRLTYSAIAVGVASVLLLAALGEGVRAWVMAQFSTLGANSLIALPGRTETRGGIPLLPASTRDLTLDDARAVSQRLPGVRRVIPLVIGEARISHGGRVRAATVVGSTTGYLELMNATVLRGSNLAREEMEADSRACVLGRTLARELGGGSEILGSRIRVGDYSYRVIGILGAQGQRLMVDLDDTIVLPVAGALKMFNRSGLFRIIVQIGAAADQERARAALESILRERHDGEEDFTILTPGAIAESFGSVIGILTRGLAGIAAISLAVAGIGVMNVMVVTVVERSPEIGLMKALGAGGGQILSLFLAEAAALSLMGGLFGSGAGYLLVMGARALLPEVPFHIPGWALASGLGVAVATGMAFGYLPAARAARLEPLDALRKRA
jgi:putative ABC transport system permease protein